MEKLKDTFEINKLMKNTKLLIKRDSQYIPSMEELDEKNKGKWIEHEEDNFEKIFNGLLDYCKDNEEIDNLDWNSVNYEIYDAQYYQEKFPGFDDKVYDILAESTKEENKIIDKRIPPLQVTEGEFTITF